MTEKKPTTTAGDRTAEGNGDRDPSATQIAGNGDRGADGSELSVDGNGDRLD
jgi:hypothetical protein